MKRNHKVFTVLALGLAAVALFLGAPVTLAAVLAAPFPALGTPVVGDAVKMADETDGYRVPSVTEALLRVQPDNFPFTQIMDQVGITSVNQVYHQFFEKGVLPRFVQVNGATSAGAAAATVDVTVDSRNAIVPGDVLAAFANATSTTRQYWVKEVPDATSIILYAMPEDTSGTDPYGSAGTFGTVPAFANNEYLSWLGNVKSEADAASQARALKPVKVWNYAQTIDHNIEMSDHAMLSQNYGQSNWSQTDEEQAAEFRKTREYAHLFNEEAGYFSTTNNRGMTQNHYKMRGLFGYLNASVALATAATNANLVDFCYTVLKTGSKRKLLIGGSSYMKTIDKVPSTANLQTFIDTRFGGLELVGIRSRRGELVTAYHPGFDDMGREDEALVLDIPKIKIGQWGPGPQLFNRELKTGQDGIDATGQYLITKEMLLVGGAGDSNGDSACHFKCTLS